MKVLILALYFLFSPFHSYALDLEAEPLQPLQQLQTNKAKAALGRRLFFDKRLSHDNTISCAHCHNLESLGGADGLKHSFGVQGRENIVNSPTVFNAAMNFTQFWDGRAKTLEDQIDGPLTGHTEMASSWKEVVQKLRYDHVYRKSFSNLYKEGTTEHNIKDAIAEFERTLITTNSRFDRYLLGDKQAISAEEERGYQLFKSYGCVACHQGKNVGGNLFQKLGVMRDYFSEHPAENKAARGRFNVTGKKQDMYYFKVPSLRLVVLTAPYFHNGSKKNLVEAIRAMAKYQLGRNIPDADLYDIISFLYTLPGNYNGRSLEPNNKAQLKLLPSQATKALP